MKNHEERFLTEKEVSAMTSFALSTLRNQRFARRGISYCKPGGGRSVRYKMQDVLDYMNSHRISFGETTDEN